MDTVDLLWRSISKTLFISREQFVESLAGWEMETVTLDNCPAWVVLTKGPEFHFQSFTSQYPITMKMIRERLQKIIDEHGYALTRTPKSDERQHRFNLAFGFTVAGEDEYDRHYRIEHLRGRSH